MTSALGFLFIIVAGLASYPQSTPGDASVALNGKDERYRIGLQDRISVEVDRHV